MKINLETYELYVIDYLEGNLSEDMRAEFAVFLLMNPEIGEELSELNSVSLIPKDEIHFDKSELKKDLFTEENIENNFDDLCVDYIENQLNKGEKMKFETYLSVNLEKEKSFNRFQKANLDKNFVTVKENFKFLLKQLILGEKDFNDEIIIAYLEGDLTKNERLYFEELLHSNSTINKKVDLYKRLIVSSNSAVTYTNKSQLRKKEKKPILLWTTTALAASIFLFGFLILQRITTTETPNLLISENRIEFNETLIGAEILKPKDSLKLDVNVEKHTNKSLNIKNETSEMKKNGLLPEPERLIVDVPLSNASREIELKELKLETISSLEEIKLQLNTTELIISENSNFSSKPVFEISKIKFWKFASLAVNLYNKATQSELLLNSEYDADGNLLALDIITDKFNYSKEYNRPR